jgi:small subunit ribosomal protein S1
MRSRHIGKNIQNENEFSRLLEQSFQNRPQIEPGESVVVSVNSIKNRDFVFIGNENLQGVIPREELLDQDGMISVNTGEKLTVFFVGMEAGEFRFTTKPLGRIRQRILESARRNRIPLNGRILRQIKGGFEVQLGDAVAFCPASQMAVKEETGVVQFIVTESDERRTIVSNRMVHDIEKEKRREVVRNSLQEGDIVNGTVVRIQPFGAFVDIGGIEGLIPVSECAYARIKDPSEVLKTGEEVRAKVLRIDWKEGKIALSLKSLLKNPWQGSLPFSEGEIVSGQIDAIKTFGLFVKLTGNFVGLVPLSETGLVRGKSVDKEYHRGQSLRVMIRKIDRENERISLSLSAVDEIDSRKEYEEYIKKEEAEAGEISSFGKALLDSLKKKG